MEITLSGIVTLVKLSQPQKAKFPMEVTLSGIVTLVKLLQLPKAKFPMEVRPVVSLKSRFISVSGLFKSCNVLFIAINVSLLISPFIFMVCLPANRFLSSSQMSVAVVLITWSDVESFFIIFVSLVFLT